jgi:uncharacterized protein YwqG
MMRSADPAEWLKLFEKRGLDHVIAQEWARHARPHISLLATATLNADRTPPGSSKLGGEPDLPNGMLWPCRKPYEFDRAKNDYRPDSAWEERPLDFLAQINLRDVSRVGTDLALPESGLLLFFYDTEVQPWGFDPDDAAGWQMLYVAEQTLTQRSANPEKGELKVQPLDLQPSEGLPSWEWVQKRVDYEHHAFHAQLEKLAQEDWERLSFGGNTFGGWPSPIQAPMELECEMVSNGVYAGDSRGYSDSRMADFERSALDWKLLLQIDSNDDLGWMWGDVGIVYSLCREQDISAQRFDRTWTVLQCT